MKKSEAKKIESSIIKAMAIKAAAASSRLEGLDFEEARKDTRLIKKLNLDARSFSV